MLDVIKNSDFMYQVMSPHMGARKRWMTEGDREGEESVGLLGRDEAKPPPVAANTCLD